MCRMYLLCLGHSLVKYFIRRFTNNCFGQKSEMWVSKDSLPIVNWEKKGSKPQFTICQRHPLETESTLSCWLFHRISLLPPNFWSYYYIFLYFPQSRSHLKSCKLPEILFYWLASRKKKKLFLTGTDCLQFCLFVCFLKVNKLSYGVCGNTRICSDLVTHVSGCLILNFLSNVNSTLPFFLLKIWPKHCMQSIFSFFMCFTALLQALRYKVDVKEKFPWLRWLIIVYRSTSLAD